LSIDEVDDRSEAVLKSLVAIIGLGISFMHCKNVVVTERDEIPSRGLSKNPNTPPSIRYRVVDISGFRKNIKKSSPTESNSEATQRALHVCRGHFATYTDEAPLFGKHVGQFWIPDHARGSFERGAVIKDYETK
jgi:hypothetical protein